MMVYQGRTRMNGCYERTLTGNMIVLPRRWPKRDARYWRCEVYNEQGVVHLKVGMQPPDRWSPGGRPAAYEKASLFAGCILLLPESVMRYLENTHQNTVTLAGMQDHFEFWPSEDYERMEEEDFDCESLFHTQAQGNDGMEEEDAETGSTITLSFAFANREAEDLEQINRLLQAMELTDVKVEDFDSYLATTEHYQDGQVVSTTHRYGLDKLTLVCRKADAEPLYRYQLATEVLEEGHTLLAEGKYSEYWREQHPERSLRTVITLSFEAHTAVVVLYCESIAAQA